MGALTDRIRPLRQQLRRRLTDLRVEMVRALGPRYLDRDRADVIELDVGRFPYMGFGASIGWIVPAYVACERLSARLAILNPDRWPFGGGRPQCAIDRFIDFPDAEIRHGAADPRAVPFAPGEWVELAKWGYNDPLEQARCLFGYRPEGYRTLDEYRSAVLRRIYQPSAFARAAIDAQRAFVPPQYVAWHIRRGDKTSGPWKEDDAMPLSRYVQATAAVLERNPGLANAIVVCSDSDAAVAEAMDFAARDLPGVRMVADPGERRWDGYVALHRTGQVHDVEEMVAEVLTAQKNLDILRRADHLVGCNSSCLFRTAALLRPNLAAVTSLSENKKWKKYYPI